MFRGLVRVRRSVVPSLARPSHAGLAVRRVMLARSLASSALPSRPSAFWAAPAAAAAKTTLGSATPVHRHPWLTSTAMRALSTASQPSQQQPSASQPAQAQQPTPAPSQSSGDSGSGSGGDSGNGGGGGEPDPGLKERNRNIAYYVLAVALLCVGGSYAVVPLYRKFCQVTGMGGIPQETSLERLAELRKQRQAAGQKGREILVTFTGAVNGDLDWEFTPVQDAIRVRVGEPALAFYAAKNKLDHPVVGVATYNVNPARAGLYFNKVQCFCFDEQRVHGGEDVQLPVHFFLDTALEDDPKMDHVHAITLHYTFFEVEHEYPEEPEPAPAIAVADAPATTAAAAAPTAPASTTAA